MPEDSYSSAETYEVGTDGSCASEGKEYCMQTRSYAYVNEMGNHQKFLFIAENSGEIMNIVHNTHHFENKAYFTNAYNPGTSTVKDTYFYAQKDF